MKRYSYTLSAMLAALLLLATPTFVSAQMMTGQSSASSSSSSDEQKGEVIYNELQNKQTTCSQLTNDDFDVLGDFYMARMMGSTAHSTMDQQMTQHMGDTANTQMHVAMAKRLSGCDPNAAYPASAGNYAPVAGMTGMMGASGMMNGYWNMMGYHSSSWSSRDTLLSVLLVLAVIVALLGWFRPVKKT